MFVPLWLFIRRKMKDCILYLRGCIGKRYRSVKPSYRPRNDFPWLRSACFSQRLRDGFAHVVNVLLVQRRHADASAADDVDAVFVAQPLHSLPWQTRVREHPPLAHDEAEILLDAFFAQPLDQQFAHPANALAHLGEFTFPADT